MRDARFKAQPRRGSVHGNHDDAAALTKAFRGARAVRTLRARRNPEEQERDSDDIAKAVKESGVATRCI